jgi:hypothetical protein
MTTTDRWTCSVCGTLVSKQMGQHTHLRVRRPDGTGRDHIRCRPPIVSAQDALRRLESRRAEAALR